jgi:hypothetical protein
MAADLLTETKRLLGACPISLPRIAEESGLGYEWLKKLRAGDIENPGVLSVQELHDFLAANYPIDPDASPSADSSRVSAATAP